MAATKATSDTSELFVRAAKLIGTGINTGNEFTSRTVPQRDSSPSATTEQLQPHVKTIMRTLLEGPARLDDKHLYGLLDPEFCEHRLGLKISSLPLPRHKHDGREVSGHARYWADVYADSYYVCSQWWSDYHLHNAGSLLAYQRQLRETASDGPPREALDRLSTTVSAYIERNSSAAF